MNKLTLQQIQGNSPDEIASTGHELVQAFNGNFDLVKEAIENLDQRLFNDFPVTSMAQLDDLRSGTYHILLTVSGGIEQFYLICTIDPDGRTVRQTRISDSIYIRTFAGDKWTQWKYYQENFLVSEFGKSKTNGITQKAFTDHVQAIEKDLGNKSTSESEDGTVWGKLISILQDISSNSDIINNIEITLSKASLFNNLGIITGLSDLDDVKSPGYYTYSNRLNEGETINGILVVSRMSYPGSFSIVQFRHELGKTYQREYDIDERAWEKWEEQTVVMSESDYEQLEFKDQSTFYYTYED